MITGAVLQYPGSMDNYSEIRAINHKEETEIRLERAVDSDRQAEAKLHEEFAAGFIAQKAEGLQVSTVSDMTAKDAYNDSVQESSGSKAVFQSLLMRENASTGTTEANYVLARIRMEANAKDAQERAERKVLFDTTRLAEAVKASRDFLAGKINAGTVLDIKAE